MVDGNEDVARGGVETDGGVIVADAFDRFTDDRLMINRSFGSDLSENHYHSSFDARFAGNFRVGIHLN